MTEERNVEEVDPVVIEEAADPTEGLVVVDEVLPDRIPILPVRPRPYFPGAPAPVQLDPEQVPVLNSALEDYKEILGLVLVRDLDEDDGPENFHRVGTVARALRAVRVETGQTHLLVNCIRRFVIDRVESTETGWVARVTYPEQPEVPATEELKAYSMAVVGTLKELVQNSPLQAEAIKMFLGRTSLDDPGLLADIAVNLTSADGRELQDVLETWDVVQRIDKALVLLKKELEITKLKAQISKQIEEKVSAQQREFFLKEQLRAIKQELGVEKDGKSAELERFRERIEENGIEGDVARVVEEEMAKLEMLEPSSPEYNVTRTYLDWLTVLPWGRFGEDRYDVERAREILDRDHYGLDDVKQRILEFIAVGGLRGSVGGSILCLVGPPGVGKTSIGKSIAEAIGRKFFRFSLGGMRDEAEIKGHRRTYIGAMPGKFVQAMKEVGTSNPVLMLDEIDKIGASFRGDPASALLEVLDPEQNATFRDHYLDVPYDLSNVLFVATANQLDTIPRPLLDRMEVIRLSGYILEEKVEIAKRYLIPKAIADHGLRREQVRIHKAALVELIDGYAREAGVRGLEKQIRKIMRKAAVKVSSDASAKVVVDRERLGELLGKPLFTDDEQVSTVPGVVTGLAWTSLGGATLQIEATAVQSASKGFRQTGQLGDVMRESAEIAYSYVMARLEEFGAAADFFDHHNVHLHVPAGATPKDGPSAGITMATALISMIRRKKVRARLGMTGELTLTGKVLPIGGVREKVIAARRSRMKILVFPEGNRKDVEELPDYLRKGLEFSFAERYADVYEVAFA